MKLDFIIIGGQKCASTFVQEAIDKHPETDMLAGECPLLESPDFENNGLQRLEEQLGRLSQDRLIGIKRPNYLCEPEVPQRIYDIDPRMKLIAILRNPVDRFKSAYFHHMNNGTGPFVALDQGANGIFEGKFKLSYPRTPEILEYGMYGKYLEKYVSLFKDNILVLTFDELKADKRAVIKRCYKFLGINDSFVPSEMLDNRPQKVNYSIERAKFLALRNPYRYVYNDDRTRLFPKNQSLLDKGFVIGIRLMDKILFNPLYTDTSKPGFSKSVKERLLSIYGPDIEKTEHLLQRDLSQWKT